jgi:hypothetical protein
LSTGGSAGRDAIVLHERSKASRRSCYDRFVTGELTEVLDAARALSPEDQDALLGELLEWRTDAERRDVPVRVSDEELALVRRNLAAADRGETLDARPLIAELRRRG